MPDLDRAERYLIILLVSTLLIGLGFAAYKRSRAPAPVRVEAFTVGKTSAVPAAKKVNINSATAGELEPLKGVGKETARRIVEYRESEGLFLRAEDVMKVRGIGPSVYRKIKDDITVE